MPREERAGGEERGAGAGGRGVARDVGPTGAVAAHREESRAPALDADEHTAFNADEAAFRPVVRAPAPLSPLATTITACELPLCTTIPAQPAPPRRLSPDDRPLPLTTDVVIPAELTDGRLEFSHVPSNSGTGPTDILSGFEALVAELDIKDTNVLRDLESERIESERERASVSSERDKKQISLPKSNRPSDDIQPSARTRVKKSPTTKTVSDRTASDISDRGKICIDDKDVTITQKIETSAKLKAVERETKILKETKPQKEIKVIKGIDKQNEQGILKNDKNIVTQLPEQKNAKQQYTIKTEDQAWDMLLNEPEQSTKKENKVEIKEEVKMKSKKNRKAKKTVEDQQAKDDDDSFIEIHNIEDKQANSEDLVSISMPFEDIETTYISKTKRRSKSRTPERKDVPENKKENTIQQDDISHDSKKNSKINESLVIESKSFSQSTSSSTTKDISKDSKQKESTIDGKTKPVNEPKAGKSFSTKESPKSTRGKSPSPKIERKVERKIDDKEVYVIETTETDFPEIQITKGNKMNKKPFQLSEKKREEAVKPIKSWSSIAASKKVDDVKVVENIKQGTREIENKSPVSLQEKLFELCKRRDIMVAECDAPSELNFVEEHHAVVDLPPLEPIDFGLDNFSLEVMRDSLLETNDQKVSSPICKINIDEILSSIKETTSKAIDTSTFNLIDIQKVPARKEKGFNIVETDKITSKEVKLDDEIKFGKDELEKSSDEDLASPVLSTDSDKDEKKTNENSNTTVAAKQSKSKKSRRKKKL